MISPWHSRCKWRHLGGAMNTGCGRWVTDYHYYEPDKMKERLIVFDVIKNFKYCPFCGNQIDLPTWMTKKEE